MPRTDLLAYCGFKMTPKIGDKLRAAVNILSSLLSGDELKGQSAKTIRKLQEQFPSIPQSLNIPVIITHK